MNVCSWAQADSLKKTNPRSKISWQRLFPIKIQTENPLYSMLHKNIAKLQGLGWVTKEMFKLNVVRGFVKYIHKLPDARRNFNHRDSCILLA